MSNRFFFSLLAVFSLVIAGGAYVHSFVDAQHPADVYSNATASRDSKNCSGSHCTLTATYTDWHSLGNLTPGWAGLNVAMSIDTALLPYNIVNDTLNPGKNIKINIKSGGEIVGHAVSFFDSPPIHFQSGGVVQAETDGLTICTSRLVVSGVPLSCGGSAKTSGIADIVGKWQDSYRIFNENGQEINSLSCSSNAAGTLATCTGNATGKVKIQLTRSVTDMRWQTNNRRLPLSGNRIFPAEMISSVYIDMSNAPTPSPSISPIPTPTPQPPLVCPDGVSHFASRLMNYTQPYTGEPPLTHITVPGGQTKVLGVPQEITGISDVNFDSQGNQPGYVTVGFVNKVRIINGQGSDLRIHLNDANEPFEVFVSNDGNNFRSLGKRSPNGGIIDADFDLGGSGLAEARYVRVVNGNVVVTNNANDPTQTNEGPDIDAIEVLNCGSAPQPSPTPTPTNNASPTPIQTTSPSPTTTPIPQCSDGIDNDVDGRVDEEDAGCHTDGNVTNDGTYTPTDNNEVNTPSFDPGGFEETD